MKILRYAFRIVYAAIIFLLANFSLSYSVSKPYGTLLLIVGIILFLLINIVPVLPPKKYATFRLRMCGDGCELLILFLLSVSASIIFCIWTLFSIKELGVGNWFLNLLSVIIVEAIVFWNGIIRVYTTSAQIAIKWRVIGIVCGWIPIAHLFALAKIISIASREATFESDKIFSTRALAPQQLCATKYPLLMVHGVFFRDSKYFNYWGRIPGELQAHGAKIFYGNHQSAAAVSDSAKELADRIKEIVAETGCEKVNIIAHSKGGLDCRYALSHLDIAPHVASLTTINTPHRGCGFATYLLDKIPVSTQDFVSQKYNNTLKKFGDANPDFMAAVTDLTDVACEKINNETPDVPGVLYQSIGSRLNHATDGRFPLNFSFPLVKYFDGANDGLVSEPSFSWGSKYTFLTTEGKRGISHGDMIDLNRENIKEFDVRQFYVDLVSDLKKQGL